MVNSIMNNYSPLMQSLIMAESSGNPDAVSPKGAFGLAQLMPDTARNPGYGVLPLRDDTPEENVRLGNDYLLAMLNKYGGNQRLALAAYNSGPNSVDNALRKAGGNESAALSFLPQETQNYVPKVMGESKIMPMAASFQQEELPPGQAAESDSKNALSQLIAMQQKRLAGDPERDRRMMWMNFFANMTGNHANLGDALAAGASSIPKTLEAQQEQHNKIIDSSLASQIEIEKFKQQEALKRQELANSGRLIDAQANYYNSRGDVLDKQAVATPKISNRDEMRMMKTEEGAQAATRVERLADQGLNILKDYKTGKLAPAEGWWNQAMVAIGQAEPTTEKQAKDFETIGNISKQLGAIGLQQFGGNDTDKELQIAIESSLDPKALPATNIELLKRQKAATQILQQKPDFEAQWVAKTGGLNRIDPETGQSFGSAWLRHQKDAWNSAFGQDGDAPSDGAGDASAMPKVIKYDASGKRIQ